MSHLPNMLIAYDIVDFDMSVALLLQAIDFAKKHGVTGNAYAPNM